MSESVQHVSVDLDIPARIHIVGIGGAGMRSTAMSSLIWAMILQEVTSYSPGLDQLKSKGINVTIGHSTSNFDNPKILTKSTAILEGNPEVVAALEAGVPVLTRADNGCNNC